MRVLVVCEFSGRTRDAFLALGHDAVSCDLLPTEAPGPHIQGDVRAVLQERWDLVIAHPPCTYLANSGVRWRVERQEWDQVAAAADFFRVCLDANASRVAVENPVMHKHAGIRRPDFTVQPWQFGDPERKRTCFWTRGLPPLVPEITTPPDNLGASVHREPPGPDRWKNRSRTFHGIARAMAEQWGGIARDADEPSLICRGPAPSRPAGPREIPAGSPVRAVSSLSPGNSPGRASPARSGGF